MTAGSAVVTRVSTIRPLLVAAAISVPGGIAAQDAAVCSELMPVVSQAQTQFRALRGDPKRTLLDEARFSAARLLPGAAECDITQVGTDSSEYECTWYLADPDDLERQFSAFAGAVKTCFAGFAVAEEVERLPGASDDRGRPASLTVTISGAVELALRKWTRQTTTGRTRINLTVYYTP